MEHVCVSFCIATFLRGLAKCQTNAQNQMTALPSSSSLERIRASHEERKPTCVTAFSLPNCLTYGRILAVPAVAALLFMDNEETARWAAFAIYATAAITDFFDGYLARAWSLQSSIGKMLDPIADKLLVATCLLMLVADGTISGWSQWAAFIILTREILVSGLREFLAEIRVSVPVSTLAKWKTTLQLFAIGFLVVGETGEKVLTGNVNIGLSLLWLSAAITLYTGYDYYRGGLKHLNK
jgi:cardiolipin synthase (CMP-forming)